MRSASRKSSSYSRRGAAIQAAAAEKIRRYAGEVLQGDLSGEGKSFVLLVSRFNIAVTQRLLDGALRVLRQAGVARPDMRVIWVPGAFEIPQAAMRAALKFKPDGLVCLGAVIRGQTPHFEYICNEAARGISRVALKTGIPAAFGVLTADTVRQAMDRSGGRRGHKGEDAARTVLEMAGLFGRMR